MTKYRPVSILSIYVIQVLNSFKYMILSNFSKVLESVLFNKIFDSASNHITVYQHDIVRKRSTLTNLATFTQYVCECMNRNGQVGTIYIHIQRAFDQIYVALLVKKLSGLRSVPFSLPGYLRQREYVVLYRQNVDLTSTSGIPQGLNLVRLLFLLFISNIVDVITCQKLLFSDDLKIFTDIKAMSNCIVLQSNINDILKQCADNLKNTSNKCFCVISCYFIMLALRLMPPTVCRVF